MEFVSPPRKRKPEKVMGTAYITIKSHGITPEILQSEHDGEVNAKTYF
jgi:hypothetical protein